MDAEEKEFDLDMDIIEPPLARPKEVPREKGTMLDCVQELYTIEHELPTTNRPMRIPPRMVVEDEILKMEKKER